MKHCPRKEGAGLEVRARVADAVVAVTVVETTYVVWGEAGRKAVTKQKAGAKPRR